MDLFGKDMVIGDFKLSDYGLMLASFGSGSANDEEDLGMSYETVETYIGSNPVPVYLGAKYTSKLKPQATIVKNGCNAYNTSHLYFNEHECREILRQLTGFRGYKKMQIYSYEFDELLYFNVRITNVSYRKIANKVAGIILQMECDSQFAWSKEYTQVYHVTSDTPIMFFNTSDDLNNYLFPIVTITSPSPIANLEIKNISDENWTSVIKNVSADERIVMDCKNEILTSSISDKVILNDFNMHFIRLIAGKNEIQVNANATLIFHFRVPRKVGFLCE
ncbi:MAG: hypothetical protein HFJ10_05745 [Lachnospiraceae bacterium]|nr:hypothetical protein [Lachnospiraceae bacterium]